jgi:signal peptidase I
LTESEKFSKIKSILFLFIPATIIALSVRVYFLQTFVVTAHSMSPSLIPGDHVLVIKPLLFVNGIKKGDVIVVDKDMITAAAMAKNDRLDLHIIKRVISVSNDADNEYYYIAGDNSDVSYDSRHFGAVPREAVLGKAVSVFYPFKRVSIIR